jgi:hypothetical protein
MSYLKTPKTLSDLQQPTNQQRTLCPRDCQQCQEEECRSVSGEEGRWGCFRDDGYHKVVGVRVWGGKEIGAVIETGIAGLGRTG